MLNFTTQPFDPRHATLHYRPNDRRRNVVDVAPKSEHGPVATHLALATLHDRSQHELNTWLRYAVSGTSLVLHLNGNERLECARRIAWFVETCRRFNVDLNVEADAATRDALEILHALGAEHVAFDAELNRHWRGRAVVRRVRSFAESLEMAA
jgi:hypothetical protein